MMTNDDFICMPAALLCPQRGRSQALAAAAEQSLLVMNVGDDDGDDDGSSERKYLGVGLEEEYSNTEFWY